MLSLKDVARATDADSRLVHIPAWLVRMSLLGLWTLFHGSGDLQCSVLKTDELWVSFPPFIILPLSFQPKNNNKKNLKMLYKSATFDLSTYNDSGIKTPRFTLWEFPPQKDILCHHFGLLKMFILLVNKHQRNHNNCLLILISGLWKV